METNLTPLAYLLIPTFGYNEDILQYKDLNNEIFFYLNPLDRYFLRRTCKTARNFIKIGKKTKLNLIEYGVRYKYIEIVKYALKIGYTLNDNLADIAATIGNLDFLKFIHSIGYLLDDISVCNKAAASGQLECLKFLDEIGCTWNPSIYEHVCKTGQLECLKFIYSKGKCIKSGISCFISTVNGHLKCLKFLHEKRFKWGPYILQTALSHKNFECLIYAIENDCPGWEEYISNQELYSYIKEKNKKIKLEEG